MLVWAFATAAHTSQHALLDAIAAQVPARAHEMSTQASQHGVGVREAELGTEAQCMDALFEAVTSQVDAAPRLLRTGAREHGVGARDGRLRARVDARRDWARRRGPAGGVHPARHDQPSVGARDEQAPRAAPSTRSRRGRRART